MGDTKPDIVPMTSEPTEVDEPMSMCDRIFWVGLGLLIVFTAVAVCTRALADSVGPSWWATVATLFTVLAFASGVAVLGASVVTVLRRKRGGSDVQ